MINMDDYPELHPDGEDNGNNTPQPVTPPALDGVSELETIPGCSPVPQDRANDLPKLALGELAAMYEYEEQPVPETTAQKAPC